MSKITILTIDWSRDRDNEANLSAIVTRENGYKHKNGRSRTYQGVSQDSITRLRLCLDEMRPNVNGGGSYWGGLYRVEE